MRADPAPARSAANYRWWPIAQPSHGIDTEMRVERTPLLDTAWASVHRVQLGRMPHRVQIEGTRHTLLVYDRGSFVEGERWVGGERLSASGPMDVGLDVVPALARFHGMADQGSSVSCLLLSVCPQGFERVVDGAQSPALHPHPSVGLQGDLLLQLAARMRALGGPGNPAAPGGDALYLESLCMVLFREVLLTQGDRLPRAARPSGGLSPRARRVVRDFLHAQLHQKIDLESLAQLAGLSPFHFARAFKVSFGVPPYRYLLNLRLQTAAQLLTDGRLPITEIGLSVGFSCPSEFARAFKQLQGCTPRAFRQAQGRNIVD